MIHCTVSATAGIQPHLDLKTQQSVCPWQAFKPSLMFVGKARTLAKSEGRERGFTQVDSSHTRKHKTRME